MTEDERFDTRRMLQAAMSRVALLRLKGESIKRRVEGMNTVTVELISDMRSCDMDYAELEELIGKIRARILADDETAI